MKSRAKVTFVVVKGAVASRVVEGVKGVPEKELIRGRLSRTDIEGAILTVAKDDEITPIVVGKVPSREAVLRITEVYEATKGLDSEELEVSILVQPFPA